MLIPPWIRFFFKTVSATVFSLFCLFYPAFAQQYRFDHWTVDEGLPQNSVYSMTQTPDGYLWMTTFDGLMRFDGVRFTVFNKSNLKGLPSNRFIYVFAETNGTLWAASDTNGLIKYQNGQIQAITAVDELPLNRLYQIQKDVDGSLLIITRDGFVRWNGENFNVEKIPDIRDLKIYISSSGWRWELDKKGLRRINQAGVKEEFSVPFDIKKISDDPSLNYISTVAMFEDKSGSLWLAAAGNLYLLKNGVVSVFTAKNGMPESIVTDIAEDSDGKIWIGTNKNGVCQLIENNLNCYDKSKGLSSNFIRDIFLDREGTLWLTTDDGGINRLTQKTVTPLSIGEGLLEKNIYPIFRDDSENIWVGSAKGLSQITNGKIKNYSLNNPLSYEIVQALHEDDQGRLWIGAVGGIQYLKDGKIHEFTPQTGFPKGAADYWDIHQSRDGIIWFASNQGLFQLKKESLKRITTEDGLPTNDVRLIFEKKDGSFLLGTFNGLSIMTSDGKIQQTLTEKDGLAGNFIRSIYEDTEGTLWIGTYDSGLSRLKDGKFTNYNTSNGMFSNGVFAILEDNRSNFWMSSNQGIYRVSKQELNDFADGKISNITSTAYGKSDGMLNAECNGGRQPSALKNKDGKLWFPTQDGIAIIDPEAVPFNPNPPPVVIESAALSGMDINLKDKLEIQPNQDNLVIKYTGLSFIKPEQTRFRYKLDGLDENWIEAGTRREAYYPYLPPGNYTFRVIAANSDNVWNQQGAALEITVYPAFYRTWAFLFLIVLIIILFVFWLYSRRISEIQRKQLAQEEFSRKLINAHETERRRIAAELHDSLGQHLAMIKNSAVFGSQIVKNLNEAKKHLGMISEQSAQAITEVREISHNLRPYLLDRLGLTKAINSMLNKITDTTELNITTEIEDIGGVFTNEVEMSIYRIIQESLNNILKHAQATEVKFSAKNEEQFVIIEIADNGKGFEVGENKKDGFGLLGMKERAKMIGGEVLINSQTGKGTTVFIKLQKING